MSVENKRISITLTKIALKNVTIFRNIVFYPPGISSVIPFSCLIYERKQDIVKDVH